MTIKRIDCKEMLKQCSDMLGDRGNEYGEAAFEVAADFARTITGHTFDAFDIAIALLSIKLARYKYQISSGADNTAALLDTCQDAANYILLAERERKYLVEKKRISKPAREAHGAGDGSSEGRHIPHSDGSLSEGCAKESLRPEDT